jgi:chloramphenicol 3-O phosphotransferase
VDPFVPTRSCYAQLIDAAQVIATSPGPVFGNVTRTRRSRVKFAVVSVRSSPGQIVILNGAPRSGKSSIAAAIQETFPGVWVNIGVDVARAMTPPGLQPGVGLRPGASDHPAAAAVPALYAALWESVAAHARLGLNVVVDVGLYEIEIATDAARRLAELPVLFVGVRCDVETIIERRRAGGGHAYAVAEPGEPVPQPVLRWQHDVHDSWTYDIDVDTSTQTPQQCAVAIKRRLEEQPGGAFAQIGGHSGGD